MDKEIPKSSVLRGSQTATHMEDPLCNNFCWGNLFFFFFFPLRILFYSVTVIFTVVVLLLLLLLLLLQEEEESSSSSSSFPISSPSPTPPQRTALGEGIGMLWTINDPPSLTPESVIIFLPFFCFIFEFC